MTVATMAIAALFTDVVAEEREVGDLRSRLDATEAAYTETCKAHLAQYVQRARQAEEWGERERFIHEVFMAGAEAASLTRRGVDLDWNTIIDAMVDLRDLVR